MPRYAAFLRGVSPMNAKMPQLKRAFEAADPYKGLRLESAAKRVVTFVRAMPEAKLNLPIEQDGASILRVDGITAFSAYLPTPKGPVFMTLLQKTFGKEQTTRTWQTIEKVVKAA